MRTKTLKTFDAFSPASEMLWALRAGQISAVELLELHLRRVHRYDPALNSIVVRDFDRARRDAAAADARRAGGDDAPLLGLPVTVKESIDVRGLPTTAGVPARREHRAAADALTVRRLRAAGAVVFGKTNVCTWLADFQGDNELYGRTNSPWDLARTPGGSTAGSAALAAGLSPLELGSDLAGSIRVPAAFCGLWGHKPSQGVVPYTGHFPGFDGHNGAAVLAAQGPHGRSAADVELMLDVIMGPDPAAHTAWRLELPPPRKRRLSDFRVAVLPPLDWLPVDPEILAAQSTLADQLARAGATVSEVRSDLLADVRDYYRLFRSMMWAQTSARWTAEQRQMAIDDKLARACEFHHADARGIAATAGDLLLWHERREGFRLGLWSFFLDWDVVLTPATLTPAFPHTTVPNADRRLDVAGREVEFEYMSFYPALATLAGHPATVIPAGQTATGLPIGLQVIGPFLEDRTPLTFARLLEQELGGFRPPPGFAPDFV